MCQQQCLQLEKAFYAVGCGVNSDCYCSDTDLSLDATITSYSGDCPSEGDGNYLLGSTNLPLTDLTISQCKQECSTSSFCASCIYDENAGTCQLRASAMFTTDDSCHEEGVHSFIVSLEHFYTEPVGWYAGETVVYQTTVSLRQDCQKLCDLFSSCHSIRFTYAATDNCEILGGSIVTMGSEGNLSQGVMVAQDVNLFTPMLGFAPDESGWLVNFTGIFTLDECRTLCEHHAHCGSLQFIRPTCRLFGAAGFAEQRDGFIDYGYYVDFSQFVDSEEEKEFFLAEGLCIYNTSSASSATLYTTTALSHFECRAKCIANIDCSMFTFDQSLAGDGGLSCSFYTADTKLTGDLCDLDVSTHVSFNRAKFTLKEGFCIKSIFSDPGTRHSFMPKTLTECSALCLDWFPCHWFWHDESTGYCLLDSNEYEENENCLFAGDLYTYFSPYKFAELSESFCVGLESRITTLHDAPVEACKAVCDKHDACLSFEHSQDGVCIMYASADFSEGVCEDDQTRTLYVSLKAILNREDVTHQQLSYCFDVTNLTPVTFNETTEEGNITIAHCAEKCLPSDENSKCIAYQWHEDESSPTCYIIDTVTYALIDDDAFPDLGPCNSATSAYLVVPSNPYEYHEKTCLENKISFGMDGTASITHKDEYECLALCELLPSCRYYIYGTANTTELSNGVVAFRECVLFEAQINGTVCDDDSSGGLYDGLPGVANKRTFIDQDTWFGEPDRLFAVLPNLSYQQCAQVCDNIDQCKAFIHTWNYRKFSSLTEIPVFERTRLIYAGFGRSGGEATALFLQADPNSDWFISLAPAITNEDVRNQWIFLENVESDQQDDSDSSFRMQFLQYPGSCIAGYYYYELEEGFVRDVFANNLDGAVPFWQFVNRAPCDDDRVLILQAHAQDNRLSFSYHRPGSSSARGCLSAMKPNPLEFSNSQRDYELKTPRNRTGSFIIHNPTEEEVSSFLYTPYSSYTPLSAIRWVLKEDNTCHETFQQDTEGGWTMVSCSDEDSINCISNTQTSSFMGDTYECRILSSLAFSTTGEVSNYTDNFCEHHLAQLSNDELPNRTIWTRTSVSNVGIEYIDNFGNMVLDATFSTSLEQRYLPPWDGVFLIDYTQMRFDDRMSYRQKDLVGKTYGDGCGFDEDIASIPVQHFSFASDSIKLQNVMVGGCLVNDTESGDRFIVSKCNGEHIPIPEWTYIFTEEGSSLSGQLFTVVDGEMQCLSRNNADVRFETCDSLDTFGTQGWDYDSLNGRLVVPGSNDECLVANSLDNNFGVVGIGSCELASATWTQYTECRLNTREKTKEMKVESIDESGQCIGHDGGLVSCSSTDTTWIYYYEERDSNVAAKLGPRLRRVDGSSCSDGFGGEDCMCLGRTDLQASKTEIVDCSNLDDYLKYFFYLGGEDSNVFYWYNSVENPQVDYCLHLPTEDNQTECTTDYAGDQKWRAKSTATIMSVKPDVLTRPIIDDPAILAKFFLYTEKGKQSRRLLSKTGTLLRLVERLLPLLENALEDATAVNEVFTGITSVVAWPIDGLEQGASSFLLFNRILGLVEKIPKINLPVKTLKLKTLTKQIADKCTTGKKALSKVDGAISFVSGGIDTYEGFLTKAVTYLPQAMDILEGLADFLTRAVYCAHLEALTEEFKRMEIWIDDIHRLVTEAIATTGKFISTLTTVLKAVKADALKLIHKPIKTISTILDSVFVVIDFLDFLNFFDEDILCIPEKIDYKPLVEFSIKFECYNFNDVGNVLQKVEDFIKSIPLIGDAWKAVEKAVDFVVEMLFGKLLSFMPSFDFSLEFFDNIREEANDAVSSLTELATKFQDISDFGDLPDISERARQIADIVGDVFPSGLDSLDFADCGDMEQCVDDMLGVRLLPGSLPGVSIGNVDYAIPEQFALLGDKLTEKAGSLIASVDDLAEGGINCNQYFPVTINFNKEVREATGVNLTDELGIPDCPFSFDMCIDIEMPNLNNFIDNVTSLMSDLGGFDIYNFCTEDHDFHLKFPLPPSYGLSAIKQTLFRKSGSLNNDIEEDDGLYWKQFLDEFNLGKYFPGKFVIPKESEYLTLDFISSKMYLVVGCNGDQLLMNAVFGPLMTVNVKAPSVGGWKPVSSTRRQRRRESSMTDTTTTMVQSDYRNSTLVTVEEETFRQERNQGRRLNIPLKPVRDTAYTQLECMLDFIHATDVGLRYYLIKFNELGKVPTAKQMRLVTDYIRLSKQIGFPTDGTDFMHGLKFKIPVVVTKDKFDVWYPYKIIAGDNLQGDNWKEYKRCFGTIKDAFMASYEVRSKLEKAIRSFKPDYDYVDHANSYIYKQRGCPNIEGIYYYGGTSRKAPECKCATGFNFKSVFNKTGLAKFYPGDDRRRLIEMPIDRLYSAFGGLGARAGENSVMYDLLDSLLSTFLKDVKVQPLSATASTKFAISVHREVSYDGGKYEETSLDFPFSDPLPDGARNEEIGTILAGSMGSLPVLAWLRWILRLLRTDEAAYEQYRVSWTGYYGFLSVDLLADRNSAPHCSDDQDSCGSTKCQGNVCMTLGTNVDVDDGEVCPCNEKIVY